MVVEKDTSGHLATKDHTVEGPAVFFQTTTKTHLHVENETRMFDLFVDESEEQTEKIFAAQNIAYTNPMEPAEREAIQRRWHNAARLLEPLPVLIPFAPRIVLPNKPLRVRRDRPRVLALVEAAALLHQHQRDRVEKNGRQYIVASVEDYAIARELAITLLESVLTGATAKCRQLVRWAEERGIAFSKRDAERGLDWSRKTVLKYLREAVDLGCISMDRAKVTTSSNFSFVRNIPAPALTLPTPEDLAGLCSMAPRSDISETLSVT
jgi:hypothetical protein